MEPIRHDLPGGPKTGPKRAVLEVVAISDPSDKPDRAKTAPGQVDLFGFPHGERIGQTASLDNLEEIEANKVELERLKKDSYIPNEEHPGARVSGMSRATPQMRNFAKRLMTYETPGNKSAQTTKNPTILEGSEKLRPHLTTLMGTGGFRTLLSRALALAHTEVPWLQTVQVNADGSLAGLKEQDAQLDPKLSLEGRIVLLAQLLGLLATFIGENLTLRLMHEAWPKVPLNDLDFSKGGKNEKTK